jgi:hypothetical protein
MSRVCLCMFLSAVSGPVLTGCATRRSVSPYSTPSESDRDSLKAQRLTQEAATLIPKDLASAERLDRRRQAERRDG